MNEVARLAKNLSSGKVKTFHEEDVFLDDDFSTVHDGNQDLDDGPSSSVKRKLQTTVAGATVGK